MSNAEEFLAGTDPTNSASVFQIISIVRQANDVDVTWKAGGGKTNVLQVSTGAVNGSYVTNYFDLSPPIILPRWAPS